MTGPFAAIRIPTFVMTTWPGGAGLVRVHASTSPTFPALGTSLLLVNR